KPRAAREQPSRPVTLQRQRRLFLRVAQGESVITNSNFWLWFGGIWLAMGLLFLGIGAGAGFYRNEFAARLDREGVRVQGLVLTKEISAPQDRSTTYDVTFRFDDA